jgi:outer membrane protein assembly factor BamB
MYNNMARGFAAVVAGAVLTAAAISGISTPGSAATAAPTARALSARVSQRPPVRGTQLWVKLYSGPRATDSLPSSVAVSPGGGTVFVAGTTARAGSGTGRGSFATVAYKAATGAQLWARRYRGPGKGFDEATSMAVSGGKVFVTGSSATSDGGFGNYATIAYSAANGARLWARS